MINVTQKETITGECAAEFELTVPLSGGNQDRPVTSAVIPKVPVDRVEVTGPSTLVGKTEPPKEVSVRKTGRPSIHGVAPSPASVSSGATITPSAASVSTHISRGTGRSGPAEPKSGTGHHDVDSVHETPVVGKKVGDGAAGHMRGTTDKPLPEVDLVVPLRHGRSQPYQGLRVAPMLRLPSRPHRLPLPCDTMYQSPG